MTPSEKLKIYLKSIPHHVECGYHSNFRYCCIFDYSVIDNFNHSYFPKVYRTKRYINRVVSRARGITFGYIPCPICMLFRKPRKVISCKGFTHNWQVSLVELKKTIDKGNFNKLCNNLSKIDRALNLFTAIKNNIR